MGSACWKTPFTEMCRPADLETECGRPRAGADGGGRGDTVAGFSVAGGNILKN